MRRVSLRNVTGRFPTLLLTALSVVLGTAFVAGALVFTASISSTFDSAFGASTGSTDAVIRGLEGAGSSGFGDGRLTLPLSLAEDLEQLPDIEAAVPVIQGNALLVGADGTAVRNGNAPSFGTAFDPGDTSTTIVDGAAPEASDQVAVDTRTLERSGLGIGDTTTAVIGTGPQQVTIVGSVDAPSIGASFLYLDRESALAAFVPDGQVSQFNLRGGDGVSEDQLVDAVRPLVPAGAEVVTAATVTQEGKDAVRSALGFVNTFLLVIAGVSLLVGSFIIVNVFSMLLARRTRELALLRAVGASSPQVLGSVVVEALVVGVLGSAVGLGLGVLIALGLKAAVATFGFEIGSDLPVTLSTILVTLIVGVLVTLLSAIGPAVRASRVPPIAALRDDVALPERQARLRAALGLVLIAVGVVALLVGLLADVRGPLFWVGAGVLATFFGAAAAAPILARPVVWLISVPSVAAWGTVGRLARQNAVRNPRRTAATASALMIGTALVGAATIVFSSISASIADQVGNDLKASFVLYGGTTGVFPTTVADEVADVPGVTAVVPARQVPLLVAPQGSDAEAVLGSLGATDGAAPPGGGTGGAGDTSEEPVALNGFGTGTAAAAQILTVTADAGSLDDAAADQLAVNRTTADANGWQVDDVLQVRAGVGPITALTITAIYEDSQVLPQAIVAPQVWEAGTPEGQRGDNQVFVVTDSGADLSSVRAGLGDVVKPYYIVSVLDGDEFVSTATSALNQILGVISALLGLSIIVAVIGIVITLVLSVIERRREIGLLRAVGLSRVQLRRTVTLEGVATSVFGSLLGIVLGVVFGLSLQRALSDQGLDTLSIPWLTLVGMMIAGVVVGVVAAALPAWWASRQDVLRSIATQ